MFSHSPPRKRGSRSARPRAASRGSSGCCRRARRRPGGQHQRDDADSGERRADADRVGSGAERRADDRAEDRGPEGEAEQLAAPGARRRDREPGEGAGPRGRARGALDEAREPERPWPVGEREGEARQREQAEAEHHGPLRAEAGGGEPARDGADERAGAEGAHEQAGARLAEVELVGVAGHERRERAEEHRVHEHDRADEDQETAHSTTLPTGRSRAYGSAWERSPMSPGAKRPFRGLRANRDPLSRIPALPTNKFSEPGALSSSAPTNFRLQPCGFSLRPTGVDSTYSRPVLAARGNLGAAEAGVKGRKSEHLAICDLFRLPRPRC